MNYSLHDEKGRILLASNGEFKPEELAGIVDKQPVEWEWLLKSSD